MVRAQAGAHIFLVGAMAGCAALACGSSHKASVEPERVTIEQAAAEPQSPGETSKLDLAPAPVERDPNALAALRRMGEFLRDQEAFTVHGKFSTDEVLDTGQKIQLDATAELKVRRPDRFRLDVDSERKRRSIYYDGSSFTVYGDRLGYYAQAPAPPTIHETLKRLRDQFAISMPLVDLFYFGTPEIDEGAISSAIDIGPARIEGTDTEHYAFRQPDVDFQVWIQNGPRPLPRKLVITTLSEPSQPQHSLLLTWALNSEVDESEFRFEPPPGSRRIVFERTEP